MSLKKYWTKETLGTGNGSEVLLCTECDTGRDVAVKVIYNPTQAAKTEEIHILAFLRNTSGFVNLINHFVEPKGSRCLVFEKAEETLADVLERRSKMLLSKNTPPNPLVPDFWVQSVFAQLADSVDYLHSNFIVHRDLKPENILVFYGNGHDQFPEVKLCDFGMAKWLRSKDELLKDACGSPLFCSPELITCRGSDSMWFNPYKADVWSLGVILYVMVFGTFPFDTDNNNTNNNTNDSGDFGAMVEELFTNVLTQQPTFHWFPIPNDLEHLLRALLEKQACLRPSMEEVVEHPWVVGPTVDDEEEGRGVGQGKGEDMDEDEDMGVKEEKEEEKKKKEEERRQGGKVHCTKAGGVSDSELFSKLWDSPQVTRHEPVNKGELHAIPFSAFSIHTQKPGN